MKEKTYYQRRKQRMTNEIRWCEAEGAADDEMARMERIERMGSLSKKRSRRNKT